MTNHMIAQICDTCTEMNKFGVAERIGSHCILLPRLNKAGNVRTT